MVKNENVKNVVFLIHGVSANQQNNWTYAFSEKLKNDPLFNGWAIEQGNWGYLFFLFSIFPFIKNAKIQLVQDCLRDVQNNYPNAKIHVIAHSYGTMLVYEAVKQSGNDSIESIINLGTVILVGGIVSHYEKFENTVKKGRIERIYNFCSYKDRVIRWQPVFGKCGYWGFLRNRDRKHVFQPYPDINVQNYRFNVHHSEYFTETPPDFYVMWRQLLRLGK